MKNLLIFTIGFLGIINSKKVFATTYTHNLTYTHNDNDLNSTLTGQVTFEDGDANAQDTQWPNGATFDTGFITNLTFTYTKDGVAQTINYSDFSPGDGAEYRINHDGSVDFNVANLKAELTDIAFQTDINAAFLMTPNLGAPFSIDINAQDDFTLNTTSYHSPGPLPVLGLLTSFASLKKLKNKYKKKYIL